MSRFFLFAVLIVVLPVVTSMSCKGNEGKAEPAEAPAESGQQEQAEQDATSASAAVEITILYNNIAHDKELTTAWGFACLVEGFGKTILFDTGGDGSILLGNMKKLGVDPAKIDLVVLSHIHGDHVDGIWEFLKKNSGVTVFLPESFPESFKSRVRDSGAKAVSVSKHVKIADNIYSTGELGDAMIEQSLILKTPKGLIVITGCAHPGIVNIAKKAREIARGELYLVLGGFHLMAYSLPQVRGIIEELRQLGVVKIGPSHCTGGEAIEAFRKAWGKDFFDLGCGGELRVELGK